MEKFAAPDHQNREKDHCLKYAYCEKDEKMGLKIYKLGDCPTGSFFDSDSGKCGAAIRKPIGCDGPSLMDCFNVNEIRIIGVRVIESILFFAKASPRRL